MLAAAARHLEARPRAAAEVRRHLRDAGYDTALIEGAIERLLEMGYLDDDAFARAWVESRDRSRPRSARALRDELRRHGVGVGDSEAALAAREAVATGADPFAPGLAPAAGERAGSSASDGEAAAALLARRAPALLREVEPRRRRAKAYALLARNGFDPEVASRAVREFAAGPGPGPDEDSEDVGVE